MEDGGSESVNKHHFRYSVLK